MSDTCVPSLIVIDTAINQLENKVSLKTICCLRLFVVVYTIKVKVGNTCTLSLVVIGTTVNQFLCYILPTALLCLRLFVVVYKPLHTAVFVKVVIYV